MNTNVDLILSGTDLLNALNINEVTEAKNCQNIGDLTEFKSCFKHFFKKGSAAERSFRTAYDFDTVITATKALTNKKYFIGGNAGLMAESISNKFEDTNVKCFSLTLVCLRYFKSILFISLLARIFLKYFLDIQKTRKF